MKNNLIKNNKNLKTFQQNSAITKKFQVILAVSTFFINFAPLNRHQRFFGKMVEWSITPVLKTGVLRGTGGSNPSLSADDGEVSEELASPFSFIISDL